jgi:LPS-assembly protein
MPALPTGRCQSARALAESAVGPNGNARRASGVKPLASAVDARYEAKGEAPPGPIEPVPTGEDTARVNAVASRDRASFGRAFRTRLVGLVAGLALIAGSTWAGPTGAQDIAGDENLPIVVTADEIVFDTERKQTTAVGNAEVSRGDRRLMADSIRYDERTGKVFARGNIVLVEANGDAIFGDEMELTGDLRDGVVKGVRALLADDIRIAGVKGRRIGGNTTVLEKAVYSPCQLCPDGKGPPIWQIRAERAVHDQAARTLTYSNAVMEVFGVPVGFTPWFSHPDPTVRKQSGFLLPSVGTDSELGQTLQVPYFLNLAPNRDITLAPLFTTEGGTVLFAEGRDLETWGRTTVRGSITHTDEYQSSTGEATGQGLRGHLQGTGRYSIDDMHRAGFDGYWTSDKTYLRRYNISNTSILNNHAYIERFDDRDYYGLNAWAFQGLRESDDQDIIPVALPLAEAHVESGRMRWGSQWTLDSNLLMLTRTGGRDVRRLVNEVGWEVPQVGPWGDLRRLRLSMRGDIYDVIGDPQDESVGGGGDDTTGRVLPRATLDWSLPLVGSTGLWQHELTPLASLNIAPNGGNDDSIPNEDSIDFEFDETNLFLPSRFTGYDLNEGGTKLAYGFRFASLGPNLLSVSGVLGQSLRLENDDTFPRNSGLGGYVSHWVGRLEFRPSQMLDVSYRFRLDAQAMEFARSDLSIGIGPPRVRINLRYLNLDAEAAADSDDDLPDREAAIAGVRVQMTDYLAVAAQTRRDMTNDATVTNTYGLIYSDDCLLIVAGIEKDFTTRGEIDQPTTFTLRIGLKTLGEFETGTGLFGL